MLLHCESLEPPMSQLGHLQTLRRRLNSFRFTRESGHPGAGSDMSAKCPISRLMHRSKSHPQSITSSASASSVFGIAMPSALAVLRLTTSSNLVGCTTGRSVGFSPLRMRPT